MNWSALVAAKPGNKKASPGQGDLDLCLYLFLTPEPVTVSSVYQKFVPFRREVQCSVWRLT